MASVERWKGSRWRARWRGPNGESRSQVFDLKKDAENHLTSVQHSKLTGAYVDPKAGRMTVEAYWALWSERQQWRATTRASTTSLFARQVLPVLGSRQLASLRRGDIESMATKMPRSRRYASQATQYLASMLEAAVADGLTASNPAQHAKRPRVEAEPVVPFTGDEADRLHEAAPAWFDVALSLGLGAGLRQSEARGLTLDRVNFLKRELVVDRQLTARAPFTFVPPKTARSYRTVPLADVVVEALARHVEVHGAGQDGVVLHAPDGAAVGLKRFGDVWRTLRADAAGSVADDPHDPAAAVRLRARLLAARFHTTRHTFASTLLTGGVSVAAAAEYLGHSPAILLSTYAHLVEADHDRARAVVQKAFARDAEESSRVTSVSRTRPAPVS